MTPTYDDLLRAFELSGLERKGWDFERAMLDPTVSWAITHRAKCLVRARARGDTPGGHSAKMWNGTHPGKKAKPVTGACTAVRYSDQMCCGRCGLQWDVNDPEPPRCGRADGKTEVRRLV